MHDYLKIILKQLYEIFKESENGVLGEGSYGTVLREDENTVKKVLNGALVDSQDTKHAVNEILILKYMRDKNEKNVPLLKRVDREGKDVVLRF